ncbi:hypothetical protein [Agaribacterium haliotis]|uniref:hypothetical protein n=1 Tax=Agaribacterium haliotis TaxID=2013869 RepID=UPI000BB59F03|nr:hypothetical protein [Agaribacterium haliotis]
MFSLSQCLTFLLGCILLIIGVAQAQANEHKNLKLTIEQVGNHFSLISAELILRKIEVESVTDKILAPDFDDSKTLTGSAFYQKESDLIFFLNDKHGNTLAGGRLEQHPQRPVTHDAVAKITTEHTKQDNKKVLTLVYPFIDGASSVELNSFISTGNNNPGKLASLQRLDFADLL